MTSEHVARDATAEGQSPRTIAWFSYFPVEWLPDAPPEIRALPRLHPASWQRVLLDALQQQRPELHLHVIALRKELSRSQVFQRHNATFHVLKVPGGWRGPSLFWLDTLLIGRLVRRLKPDLLHAWGTEKGAAWVAKRLGRPHLITVQGLYSWLREIGPLNVYERLAARAERRCLPAATLVTTESTFSACYVRDHFPGTTVMQIEHAPAPLFHQVERRPRRSPRRFLFVGYFGERKGVDLLLRALNGLVGQEQFDLVMVGPPREPLHGQLRAELSPQLWQRVVFKQQLTATEVAGELAEATLLIYPTRADVSPNTVKEAVVAGVPVVASAVGGIPDYVVPGENGILFPPGQVEACARAIREACAHPLFGQGQVNPRTLERMRAYLSPDTMGRRFWEAYQRVWQQSRRAPLPRGSAS